MNYRNVLYIYFKRMKLMMSQEYGPVFPVAFGWLTLLIWQVKMSGLGNADF